MFTTQTATRNLNGIAIAGVLLTLCSSAFAKSPMARDLTQGDIAFMKIVAEGNMAEIKAGDIAAKKAASNDTRQVAKMILKDHGMAGMQLRHIAAMKQVNLPMTVNPMHKMMARQLSQTSGKAFDKMYLRSQLMDHTKTVALFQRESLVVKDPQLKKFVMENLPAIQGHTQMLIDAKNHVMMAKMSPMHKM